MKEGRQGTVFRNISFTGTVRSRETHATEAQQCKFSRDMCDTASAGTIINKTCRKSVKS